MKTINSFVLQYRKAASFTANLHIKVIKQIQNVQFKFLNFSSKCHRVPFKNKNYSDLSRI